MKWFRLYSELLHDPKVLRTPIRLRWRWVELMCIANEQDPRGSLPGVDDIALILRAKKRDVEGDLLELANVYQLLDKVDETFQLHNWGNRQYESDDSTKRVRKHRGGVARNVSVTPPEAEAEQKQIRSDPETEAETEAETDRATVLLSLHRAFEQCFGRLLTPMEIEQVTALSEEHPRERIEYGIREASDGNKRSVRYIQRVCERVAQDGNANGTDRGKSAASANPDGVAGGVSYVEQQLAAQSLARKHRTS